MGTSTVDLSAGMVPKAIDLSAGLVPSSADSRNAVQKFLDASVTPPPGEKMDNSLSGIANQAYYGVPQGVEHVVAHPLQTLQGMGQSIMHPINAVVQFGKQLVSAPVLTVGQSLGAAAAMQPAAELAGSTVAALPKVAGRAVLLGKTPVEAYESALKPSTTLTAAERASIAQTGLENAIPVSKGGLEKLGNLIDDLNDKIKDEIASAPNRPIDPNAVATRLNDTSQRFSNQVVAQPDLDAIAAQRQQFLAERGAQPGKPAIPPQPTGVLDAQGRPIMTQGTPATPPQPAPPMTAIDAQAMKQGTYNILRKKYGEQGSAVVESQKTLARGLKEEIASKFPEINDLNAAESRLLDLQPVLERAVARISNHQLIGIGTPIVGTAVKATTGSTGLGAIAMTLKGVVDNPMVKSRLAIALSKGGNMPIAKAIARVSAYSASLGSGVLGSQENSSGDTPTQ